MTDVQAVERALASYYEQEARARAERPLGPQRAEARSRFLAQLDAPRARLLEVGIGPGRDSEGFVAEEISVVGIDLSIENAQRARSTGADAVVATVRRLPFADRSFTALWTMSTLMHIPNEVIDESLMELRRVLTRGALAGVGVWGGPNVEHNSDMDVIDPPRFFSRRSNERWQSLLSILGSIEEFETWGQDGDEFWYQWSIVRTS